ncbi:phage tail sheath family protein [Paenibacillus lutimineralis]|uniref:Phage tail sheath protein n=1 Tax=Paenibacillus lutimineralis TaxID=2707005 RepID=A0A3S9UVH7_9BACL|nr:phage tail sheath family protein [Paenibacillus lutimineralis]AZS14221.1 phage tail sheath protein [Paenibacillus lutimineralis]
MAGGTFTVQNKVRPGVYINFKSEAKALGTLGERGIAAFPAPLPWGKSGITVLSSETFLEQCLPSLGFQPTDARIRHITAAMAHASKILIYRLGAEGAVKATAKLGTLTATAKYGGKRGNDLQIVIQSSLDYEGFFEVKTLLDGEKVDVQTVETAEKLLANEFVEFSGSGALTETAGTALEGGANGSGGAGEYSDALAAFEAEDFNVLGIPVDDSAVKQLAVAYTKRLREQEGKKFQTVVYDYPAANYEGVISLKNGIVTGDGLTVEPIYLLWEIAAMEAAANVNESLTYTEIPNAVDVAPKYTNSEIVQALNKGEMVLSVVNGRVVIEQDINTLTSFTADKDKKFSKNRVLRVLDSMAKDIQSIFSQNCVGKTDNNADGRNLLKGEVISYLDNLQGIGAIQNFDSQSDIEVLPGQDVDAVWIQLAVQPVDSAEKIYMSISVQ